MRRVTPFARFVRSAAVLVALLGVVGAVVHEPRHDDRALVTEDDPDAAGRPTPVTRPPTSRTGGDAAVSTATEAEGEGDDPPPPGVDREEDTKPRPGSGDRSVDPPAPVDPSPPTSTAAPVPTDGDSDPSPPEGERPVYAVDPATGRHRLLATGMGVLGTSRDGRLLVLVPATNIGSSGPLQLHRSDGTFLRTLPAQGAPISFSPDNRKIVYATGGGEDGSQPTVVFTFDLTDPGAEPVEILRLPHLHALEWSPRGDLIAFGSTGTEIVRPDGSGRRFVREESFHDWSPDGTRLVFASQTPRSNWHAEVFSTDLQGNPTPVATLPAGESVTGVQWAPNGQAVSVTSVRSNEISSRLRVFPITGGGGLDLGPVRAFPGWTRDGRHIVSFWVEPEDTDWTVTEVVLIPVDGGPRRVISRSNCAVMPHDRPSLDTGEILVGVAQPGAAWNRGPDSCNTGPP